MEFQTNSSVKVALLLANEKYINTYSGLNKPKPMDIYVKQKFVEEIPCLI